MNASDIIDTLGGPATVSKAISVPLGTVANWRARNSIPAKHHHAVILASSGKVTAEQIVLAHAETV